MIIAIDFDKTITTDGTFPQVGEALPLAIDTLQRLQNKGHILILNTLRNGRSLQMAVDFLKNNGVVFDGINYVPEKYTHKADLSIKLDADLFIDDKSLGCPKDEYGNVDWTEVRKYFEL